MANFYLDGDAARDVERELTNHGHTVQYSLDLGHRGLPDAFHLKYAADEQLCPVTGSAPDFRTLHRLWKSLVEWEILPTAHSGVLSATGQPDPDDWSTAIDLLARSADLNGKLFIWDTSRRIWRHDRF